MSPHRSPALLLSFALVSVLAGCRSREVEKVLKVTNVETGWYDAGIVDGQNKLVPTISLRIKNGADQPLSYLQLNAVFRIIDDTEELGSKVVRATEGSQLEPGRTVGPFNLSSDLGYSSPASRTQMLQHSQFRDAKVDVFIKHGSRQWVRLGEYRIARQLFAR
jgi:hypothetical protein